MLNIKFFPGEGAPGIYWTQNLVGCTATLDTVAKENPCQWWEMNLTIQPIASHFTEVIAQQAVLLWL